MLHVDQGPLQPAVPWPRPVRSVDEPWGLPDLKTHEQKAVDLCNALLKATFELTLVIIEFRGYFSVVHPEYGGPGYPSLWKLPEM